MNQERRNNGLEPLADLLSTPMLAKPLKPVSEYAAEIARLSSFDCMTCHDARIVSTGARLGELGFGDSKLCPDCVDAPGSKGIPDELQPCTFDNFDLALNPGMGDALFRCKAVADGSAWCAVLIGSPGRGKSHLAAAVLRERYGVFWEAPAFFQHVRHMAFDLHQPEEEVLRPYVEGTFVFVLDDLGKEKRTAGQDGGVGWVEQTLYAVLNARRTSRLPTIITSNVPNALDEALLSRYHEGAVAIKGGQDVRRR